MKIRWQDIPGYIGLGFVILGGAIAVTVVCALAGLFILSVNGLLYPWGAYARWKADKDAKADSFRRVLAHLDALETTTSPRGLGMFPLRPHAGLALEANMGQEAAKSFPHKYSGVEAVVLPIRPKPAN